jgi:sugar transferase EpsL
VFNKVVVYMFASAYRGWGKRLFDIIGSIVGLILLSPVLIAVALIVLFDLGSPVIFRQVRPGLHERLFTLLKFRTMLMPSNLSEDPLPDNERLTRIGRFLRKTSLDELPELINVIMGEMSLVGPRPLLVEYLSRYSAIQRRRHEVRPGITGLAQVRGRNALLFSERLSYDVEYVRRCNFWLDLKILFSTVLKVGSFELEDRAGQDISVVDDVGLHPDSPAYRRTSDRPGEGAGV